MPWTTMLWTIGIAAAILALYGLHRLGLWLEEQGLVYYWHKKPETGAARAWLPMQELVEPQVRHVTEAEEQRVVHIEDETSDPLDTHRSVLDKELLKGPSRDRRLPS